MRTVRRITRRVRHLGGFARLAGAIVLLAILWVGTVKGVDRGSQDADGRRVDDRVALGRGFADSVNDWLDDGLFEAPRLANSVGNASGPTANQAVNDFVAQPNAFTRSAMVFSGERVSAASMHHAVLVGLRPQPCVRGATTDTGLLDLVALASTSQQPVVSPIIDVPTSVAGGPARCEPAVAVAAAAGSGVAVVVGDLDEARMRLSAAALIKEPNAAAPAEGSTVAPGGTRVLLVTGAVALDPVTASNDETIAAHEYIVETPARVASFVERFKTQGVDRDRYAVGSGGAEVLATAARVSPAAEWALVLEQDAAIFDIELQSRPSVVVASILTIVFAVVFGLLLYFDVRRSRERRRTDVAKNAFFSIAGHELRTPLTSLKGFAETLSSNWDDIDDDRRQLLVDRMVPQTRRLDRLVERLLVAASIQADTHARPQIRDTDPVPLLHGVADQFREEAPLHTFTVRAIGDPGYVHADPRALDQVLQHLVDNAVKYSPSGGEVRLRVGRRDDLVHILVEDEGIGLPSDHRHIFDKFVQGESVTTRAHDEGGVGLGLFIVRTLVEDMGGAVRAEPWESGGARFIVSLRPAEAGKPKSPLGSAFRSIRQPKADAYTHAGGARSD